MSSVTPGGCTHINIIFHWRGARKFTIKNQDHMDNKHRLIYNYGVYACVDVLGTYNDMYIYIPCTIYV